MLMAMVLGILLITDFSNQTSSNSIYLFLGSNTLEGVINLNSDNSNSTIIHQSIEDNIFGEKVLIANLKSDTFADIIIASPQASIDNGSDRGVVYVLYGRTQFETNYDFGLDVYDEVYLGESNHDKFGSSLNVADFNNDLKTRYLVRFNRSW